MRTLLSAKDLSITAETDFTQLGTTTADTGTAVTRAEVTARLNLIEDKINELFGQTATTFSCQTWTLTQLFHRIITSLRCIEIDTANKMSKSLFLCDPFYMHWADDVSIAVLCFRNDPKSGHKAHKVNILSMMIIMSMARLSVGSIKYSSPSILNVKHNIKTSFVLDEMNKKCSWACYVKIEFVLIMWWWYRETKIEMFCIKTRLEINVWAMCCAYC